VFAQDHSMHSMDQLTAADYDRAASMLSFTTAPLVDGGSVRPTYLPDGKFWYVQTDADGAEFVMIDPVAKTRKTGRTAAAIGVAEPEGGSSMFRRGGIAVKSPDETKEVFIRDWNLWVRDLATKKETQLTKDGIENFGYATDNAGWTHSDRAIVLWSPD